MITDHPRLSSGLTLAGAEEGCLHPTADLRNVLYSDRIVPKQMRVGGAAAAGGQQASNLGLTACHALQHVFAFSVPTQEALDVISSASSGGKIVEVGAGTGYWAMLLQNRGCDVVAYDISPASSIGGSNLFHANSWTSVIQGNGGGARGFDADNDASAAQSTDTDCAEDVGIFANNKHADRTLLMCWPVRQLCPPPHPPC